MKYLSGLSQSPCNWLTDLIKVIFKELALLQELTCQSFIASLQLLSTSNALRKFLSYRDFDIFLSIATIATIGDVAFLFTGNAILEIFLLLVIISP